MWATTLTVIRPPLGVVVGGRIGRDLSIPLPLVIVGDEGDRGISNGCALIEIRIKFGIDEGFF